MIADLASGKLKPTPEILEKLRQYEEEGARRDYEKYAWDEARARAEAAGGRGWRETTVPYGYDYGYDYGDGYDREAFQDYARMPRKKARAEASASASAAGRGGGLAGTGGLQHEARDKSVRQPKEFIQIDSGGLAKPVLGLGTELPDRSQFRTKRLPSVHARSQIMPEVPEKMIHYGEGLHQDYANVCQLQQPRQEASAGAMGEGSCEHERMMLYEDALQELTEFERLHKASFSATAGGVMDQKMTGRLVRQAASVQSGMLILPCDEILIFKHKWTFLETLVEGMVQALTPYIFSKEFVYAPLLEFVGRYPKWLGANRDKLSKQEYEQYERQLELMVNLAVIYENEPQNFSKIVNIVKKILESGMPPNDIVADTFPALDLNSMRQR
ncbi:hypothetical protein EJB05_54606, partial [Eragrostis curvula]